MPVLASNRIRTSVPRDTGPEVPVDYRMPRLTVPFSKPPTLATHIAAKPAHRRSFEAWRKRYSHWNYHWRKNRVKGLSATF